MGCSTVVSFSSSLLFTEVQVSSASKNGLLKSNMAAAAAAWITWISLKTPYHIMDTSR